MESINNLTQNVVGKVSESAVLRISDIKLTFSDVIIIVFIFAVSYLFYLLLKVLMNLQVKRNRLRRAQGKTLLQLAGYIITIMAISAAFSTIGYSITYILVGSTAILVGLGFGLQQLFVDLISGVILLIDKNINYNDVIVVDIPSSSVKMQGKIIQIGFRTTVLESIDNERFVIPNSKILNSGVKSLMRDKGAVRFRIHIQVAFNTDMQLAKRLLTEAVTNNEKTEKDPTPSIVVKEFQDNGVLLEIRFWMKELFYSENILSEIRFEILRLFRENGVEIPYPRRVMSEMGKQ